MTITTLDPITALIVIDLQKGVVPRYQTVHPIDSVVSQCVLLADAFRAHGLPVVLVNVAGRAPGRTELSRDRAETPLDWTDFIPELDRQPTDHVVTKRTWGAFTNTGLEAHLRNLAVTQLVIAGIATSGGVESTARQAHELGFNVTLATDAMSDSSLDAHVNAVERIFPRLGETGATDTIIPLLGHPARV